MTTSEQFKKEYLAKKAGEMKALIAKVDKARLDEMHARKAWEKTLRTESLALKKISALAFGMRGESEEVYEEFLKQVGLDQHSLRRDYT